MYFYKSLIVILFVIVVNIEGNFLPGRYVKLSTAKIRQVTVPKPTNGVKESLSESDAVESSLSSHLSNVSGRRMAFTDIWNWDHWCQLQPKIGNCSERIVRYYYDTQIDQCRKFTYSGCGGNENNFDSFFTCQRFCSGAPYTSLKDDGINFCGIQPDAGICLALSTKYYYDVNEEKCKDFQYGGCGGNRNRFNSRGACLRECNGSLQQFIKISQNPKKPE